MDVFLLKNKQRAFKVVEILSDSVPKILGPV